MRGLLLAFAFFLALLAGYSILKPIRDEMAVVAGVRQLHWLFTATFVATLIAVPAFAAVASRFPRRRFVPWLYRLCGLSLLVFFALLLGGAAPVHVARAFFVWVSVFNLFITSVFWAFLADVFTPAQGKRLFGFVAAGGTIGAMAGPLLAATLAPVIGPAWLLPLSALLFEGAARAAGHLARWSRDAGTPHERAKGEKVLGGSAFAGFSEVARSPYLLGIAGQTLLFAITSTVLYAQYLGLVEGAIADGARRTALFGYVEFGTNLLALGLQLTVSGRLLARFGIGFGLALQPVLTIAGFLALGVAPFLGPAVGLYGARRSAHYAIERPARETLFTTVDRASKYKAKSFIDTVVYRGGDAVSGWLNSGFLALGLGAGGAALAALPFACAGLLLALLLARRHLRATEEVVS